MNLTCGCASLTVEKAKRKGELSTDASKYVNAQAPALAKKIRKFLKELGSSVAESVAKKFVKVDSSIVDQIELEGYAAFIGELTPELKKYFKANGLKALKMLESSPDDDMLGVLDDYTEKYAKTKSAALVKTGKATREFIRGDVQTAIEEGWAPAKLASAIEDNYAFSEARSMTIARTELAAAHVKGSIAGWKSSGQVGGKYVDLAADHDEYDDCDEAAAEGIIPLEDDFAVGEGSSPFHPNCLCDVVAVMNEEMENVVLLDELLKQADVLKGVKIIGRFSVPYGAGASKNGRKVYIDKSIQRFPKIAGKRCDIYRSFAIHEITEWTRMTKYGDSYKVAHSDYAVPAEKAEVERQGVDWKAYCAWSKIQTSRTEKETDHDDVPADLYTVPYDEEGDQDLVENAEKTMFLVINQGDHR